MCASVQVIVNKDGLPAAITAAAGGSVSVTTMYMTSVSSGSVTVLIEASTGGSVTASFSVTLGTSGPQLVTLPAGFSGVDAVTFTPQLGDGAQYGPADTQFAIDNLALTTVAATPTAAPTKAAPTAASPPPPLAGLDFDVLTAGSNAQAQAVPTGYGGNAGLEFSGPAVGGFIVVDSTVNGAKYLPAVVSPTQVSVGRAQCLHVSAACS